MNYQAVSQGRTVFAVPGKVSSSTSSGTNELIRDGAILIQSVDDIMDGLSIKEIKAVPGDKREALDDKIERQTKAYIYNSLTDDERQIYKNLSDEPAHMDDIMEKTNMEHAKATKALLNLELKKLIIQLPGKQFIKKGN